MLANKALYSGLTHGLSSNLQCKILYHLSYRRQRLSCKVLNVLYMCSLLLWVELLLGVFLIGLGTLTAFVSSR
jgi:hypothetical protein